MPRQRRGNLEMIMGSGGRRLPGFLSRRHFLRHSGGGVMAAGALAAAHSATPAGPLPERRPASGIPVHAASDERRREAGPETPAPAPRMPGNS